MTNAIPAPDWLAKDCLDIGVFTNRLDEMLAFWQEALHYKGNTGVKLQYSHCRLISLEQNCGVKLAVDANLSSLMTEASAITLAAAIARSDMKTFTSLE